MTEWAIRARGLGKMYRLYARPADRLRELLSPTRRTFHREVWALKDVDFEARTGTITGIVGVNGAGKSTLLKLVAGSLSPTTGTIEARGRISSILELGTGFQPHLTGRQNALVNALFLGLRPWEAEARLDEVLDFAELGQYSDQPLSTYSSGMQARLAFAVITTLEPEVLILDEALATGDAGFAQKCKTLIRKLCSSQCTTLVASHDLHFIREVCDEVVWIDHGQVKMRGEPDEVVNLFEEMLGVKHVNARSHAPRPRTALLKIDSADPGDERAHLVYGFAWLEPGGRASTAHTIGDELSFHECAEAAVTLGFTPGAARAGWGPSQHLANGLRGRACEPRLGPGGSVYLALPVPPPPHPVPTSLRIRFFQGEGAPPAVVSILANGRFREIARLTRSDAVWPIVDVDVSFVFADEGKRALALEPARFHVPAGVDL
jgi:ABC-type polysaccharide/polyol phosphate transport system ATPase subunit